ncbi:hypothetical protein IW150_000796, partial [Coemansia sp. RSA 2607]
PTWAAIASGSPESLTTPSSPPPPRLTRYSAMHLTKGRPLDPTTLPVKIVHEKTDNLTVAFDTPEKTTLADFTQALTTADFTECIIGHSSHTCVATARLPTQDDWHKIQETPIIIDGTPLPLRRICTFDQTTTSVMLHNVYGHSAQHMVTAIKQALTEHGMVLDIILGRIEGQTTKNAWALIQLPDPEKKLPTTIEINGDTVSLIGTVITEACRYCRQPDHTINECRSHPGNRRRNAKKLKLPEDRTDHDQLNETQKRNHPIRQLRQPSPATTTPIATPNPFAILAPAEQPVEQTPTTTRTTDTHTPTQAPTKPTNNKPTHSPAPHDQAQQTSPTQAPTASQSASPKTRSHKM